MDETQKTLKEIELRSWKREENGKTQTKNGGKRTAGKHTHTHTAIKLLKKRIQKKNKQKKQISVH